MTGKRPRALTRTASVSQLGSGNFSQEFSPLPENPKEKLKPTIKEPPSCAPRVVIGFDPKPASANFGECSGVSPKSAPCSPCFQDKASSPRSGLNSLFSRQRCVKPVEGVGLGIALHAHAHTPASVSEEVKISIIERPIEAADHIAIPVRDDLSPQRPRDIPVVQSRRHSHPIPTPGISPCHFSQQQGVNHPHHPENKPAAKGSNHQQVARPVLGWVEQDTVKVDRRDTFLLGASPARGSLMGREPAGALTASTHFLDECSFCKRHLPEDKDIFMYRGDKAFCSVECRSQQMLMDERSKNCSSSALKRGSVVPSRRGVAPASSVAAA